MYSIKQVSEKLNIQANAVRFYEEKGLISPGRGENNYREYSVEDISRLEMIILYRKMGFSIEAIGSVMAAHSGDELLNQFVAQYNILNQHIHTMTKVRETLGESIELMLNSSGPCDDILEKMEKTADIITASNEWEDKWNFDNWASHYDADIRRGGQGLDFYVHYDEVICCAAGAAKGKRIVEIGIGTGNLAAEILKRGIRPEDYTGVDQSVNMLREAGKKCPGIQLRIGTFLQLPLGDNVCDTVISSYAFHHCSHDEKILAIAEMDRIAEGHGRIVIADLMFADENARKEYEEKCSERAKDVLNDEFFGNADEIEGMLKAQGYECRHERVDELIWVIWADKRQSSCNY
ncbi:MerR family transcriptional regulator [Murimonas intestini]|uniref:AdoMet-dependent methyltransferase n=1 Tax=Murimonas intestini TaxID=1337051 RepID=A0AB73T013_9FIRM|nr:MerR family transcriptional regulator [Murimonas intestini]MCR1843213.1 MerR family transcriptional regulator [Murimonas intestini]MCR1868558.1 MerR family transcriptional regulator [Murimonas intestini]MCR1885127.1 MerR family transcriptional regulator [Murimonas intestini]